MGKIKVIKKCLDISPQQLQVAKSPNIITFIASGPIAEKQIGACNQLENLINDERRKYGYPPLKCDLNMGWVANQHIINQIENGFTGFEVRKRFTRLSKYINLF